ncbi:hypothetical protein WAK64_15385 [Bacillus spongiae]|uniref:Spore coat protein n=1 Tax=Bacillus spongiae TaxID=2683610 RepID=A0ABU8HGM1_9BACI
MNGSKNDGFQGQSNDGRDRFSQLMFGPPRNEGNTNIPTQEGNESNNSLDINSLVNGHNPDQIMNQLVEIYDSIQELKPIVSEFTPVVDYLKKKLKL